LAVTAGGNQLAVDDAGFCRESQDGRGDRWEPARKVASILTEDRRGQARFVQLHDGSRRISAHKASPRPSAAIL
jgi:hypothetical protein